MKIFNRGIDITTNLILRLAVGTVFLWFGIDKFVHTANWMGYLPPFVMHLPLISPSLFMALNGIFEIAVGVCLIANYAVFPAAAISGLYMLAIVFILGADEISIRDNALIGCCLALTIEANAKLKRPMPSSWVSALFVAFMLLLIVYGVMYLHAA